MPRMQYGAFLRLYHGPGKDERPGPLVGPFRSDSVRNSIAFMLGVPAGEKDEVSVLVQWGNGPAARWAFVEDFLRNYDHLIEGDRSGIGGVPLDWQLRAAMTTPDGGPAPVPTYAQVHTVLSLYDVIPEPHYVPGGPCPHCGGSGRGKFAAADGQFGVIWRYQDGSETSPSRFKTLTAARQYVATANRNNRTPYEIIGPDGRVYE